MQSVHGQVVDLGRRRLAREGTWLAAGRAVTAIAGLVSIRIFTELVPESVFGSANLLIGMLTLGMHALIAPITQTQLRFHTPYNDVGDGDRYTWFVGYHVAGSVLAVTGLMWAVLLVWPSARAGAAVTVMGWLALWIVVSNYKGVLIGRVSAQRQQKRYALWTGSEAVLLVVCTAGVLALWPTVEGYIAGQALGVAVAAFGFGRLPARPPATDTEHRDRFWSGARHQILSYGMPFVPFALLGWVLNLSDRYLLAAYLDTAAVGQYVAAFAIASRLPMLLGGLLNDLFRPVLFDAENRSDHIGAGRLFSVWFLLLAIGVTGLVFLLMVFGDVLARTVLAESYRTRAAEIMCWIATGYGLLVLAQAVETRLLSFGASRVLIWTKLAGAISNLTVAILLIPNNGIIGAAQANAVGHGIMLLVTLAMLTKVRETSEAARL